MREPRDGRGISRYADFSDDENVSYGDGTNGDGDGSGSGVGVDFGTGGSYGPLRWQGEGYGISTIGDPYGNGHSRP